MKIRSRILPLAFLLLGGALGITGCGSSTATVATEQSTAAADSLLSRLRASYATTPNLALEGDIKISGMGITVWYDALVRQRDSLKVNLTGPFGITVGGLAATADEFTFLNVQEGEVVQGRPDKETMGKMVQLGLDYDEMVSMMRGELPRFPAKGTYGASEQKGVMYFRVNTPETIETFSIDMEKLAVLDYKRSHVMDETTQEEFAVTYKDFQRLGGRQFPKRASVIVAGGERRLTVVVEKVQDRIPADRSCSLDIPEGMPRRRM